MMLQEAGLCYPMGHVVMTNYDLTILFPSPKFFFSGEDYDTMDRPEATGVTADTVDKSPEDFSKMSTLSMSPGLMNDIAVGTSK